MTEKADKRVVVEHKHTSDRGRRDWRQWAKISLGTAAGLAAMVAVVSFMETEKAADVERRLAALESSQRAPAPVECRPVVVTAPIPVKFELEGFVPHGNKK